MRAAFMKSKSDFIGVVIPVERVFHFVSIMIVLVVGYNFRNINDDLMFAKHFGN